ncbi:superinfection exclusion B family protein [Escherichia coli]|uniref:superinfection exclusion B family protein n=1 Tax=Escherichia coli TaxID=562 RepID=UPI002F2604A9
MKIKDILEILKLPLKYLIAIFLVLASLLFLPNEYIMKLGIEAIVQKYKMLIGLAFLCDALFIITHVLDYLFKFIRAWVKYKSIVREGKKRLSNLTEDEKVILRKFIENGSRTSYLSIRNGNVIELVNSKIIYRSGEVSVYDFNFAYNLNQWAWDHLNKNKKLLD